jgi:anthranilate phosphoribosyltransferase
MGSAAAHSWPEVLSALIAGQDLSAAQAAWAMEEIFGGTATPAQVAGFAVALRAKGETVDEVEGLVRTMYAHAVAIDVPGRTVDVVGTGGDRAHTVNLSTMAAIVVAGAGATVVKHGNRAASSKCGTADVLERLGVRLDLPPATVADVGREAGITFCFAPMFHPALRHAAVPRRELGVGTVFNFLGPLANPARPSAQAVGCADLRMAPILAGVLARRGVDAVVFRGDDGLDELTITTTSQVWVVTGGAVRQETLDPAALGLATAPRDALRGGDVDLNADVVRRVLDGETGPVRDAVVLNAGAALAAHSGDGGDLHERVSAGMARAVESLDSGAAKAALARWVETSTRLSDA